MAKLGWGKTWTSHSSVNSSAPTILWPQVQIPSMLFQFKVKFHTIFVIALWEGQKWTKRGPGGPYFKRKSSQFLNPWTDKFFPEFIISREPQFFPPPPPRSCWSSRCRCCRQWRHRMQRRRAAGHRPTSGRRDRAGWPPSWRTSGRRWLAWARPRRTCTALSCMGRRWAIRSRQFC